MNDIAVVKLGPWQSQAANATILEQQESYSLAATLPESKNDQIIGPLKVQGYGYRLVSTRPWYGLGILSRHKLFHRSFTDGTGPSKFKPCLR